MRYSVFGDKFGSVSGIGELMIDMGLALDDPEVVMMGGGNPALIREVEDVFRCRMESIIKSGRDFEDIIGRYDSPAGKKEFICGIADFFYKTYGWNISYKNVAVTNGSQNAFFYLFNMFAGRYPDNTLKKICFPLVPEYIGYTDQGLEPDMFTACKPLIKITGKNRFKYMVDFDNLNIDETIGAICVTRPTNPTGNLLTDDEMTRLLSISKKSNIPLIIDNAYGDPFPGIIFKDAELFFDENVILSFSLSKLGLPSLRTGFVIAAEEVITRLESINAVVNLAPGSFGQAIFYPLLEDMSILTIKNEIIKPYYKKRSERAIALIDELFPKNVDFYVHENEGAFFLWLWFKELPVTSKELYKTLKSKGILVIPGEYFFPGIEDSYAHKYQCIRITYSQEESVVERGIRVISDVIRDIYRV